MRIFLKLAFLALVGVPVFAQIPAPQINLTGNIGCQGFPCTNSGTLIFASDANHTMTAQESSAFNIKVTSSVSLTATRNLISPAGRFAFTIENATTGGQAIQIIGPSGTGVTIANGVTVSVWNDGTNYVQAGSNTGVSSINTVPGAFTFGSGSSCTGTTCTFPGTGGTALPITYVCTGSGDLTAINGYLATSGTWLTLDTRSHACATNNQIIMFSTDRLTVLGPNGIMSAMPSAGDGDGNDEASITNEAIVNPTTIARTCTLAAGSTAVTGCSGASFTNADVAESFSCPAALATGVALQTTIGQVTSGTAIVLSDATGSGITPGSFSCTETIRDHDIVIDMTGSQISMTSVYGSAPRPQELAIGHANRVTVMGGNWIDPDGTSDWHQVFFDVSQVLVQNEKLLSFSGYGQDGVDFEGPWRAVTVKDINCDTSDDCVALKPGEWDGAPYNKPFRNTNGAGVGAYISNIQGSSGSHGVAIYAPGCVNPSGTCVSSNVTDVVIDTLVGQAIATDNGYPPSYGIGSPPVGLECLNGAASDCGTVAYADHIRIAHVLGTSPTGSVNGMRVNIGASINMNQYFGNIQISDVGPDGSTYGGDVGAITVTVPTSMSYSTNITTLSIYDSGYTGNHGLFGITSSNATITNFFSDNPNLSLYTFSSATITSKFIAGGYLEGVPFCNGFTPTTGQAIEYTTASSPNPCYTAATPSGSGITQLTGDVTAGPGSGSQAASVVKVNGAAVPASAPFLTSNSSSQLVAGGFTPAPAVTFTDESSTFTPANNGAYFVTASVSTATPAASAFTIFTATTSSSGSLALTGTAIADGGNCSGYIVSTTLTLPASETATIKSDGTTIRATCTAASGSGSGNTTSTSLTSNVLPKANGANSIVNSSVTDNATTVTTTDTGGYVAPVFQANGSTAGFVDYPQGSDSGSVAPCNTATSICEEAPTSVTSYKVIKHGAAATGFLLRTNSSSVETESVVGSTGSGNVVLATSPTISGLIVGGTQAVSISGSGCSISSQAGGLNAGTFAASNGTSLTACTVTIALPTAPHGWACAVNTIGAGQSGPTAYQSATSTTSAGIGFYNYETATVNYTCTGY
jgi:hypothetical protein